MNKLHMLVGVWYVKAANAPFEHHVFTFHADGTMLQANPDAGDPITSDSNGMGVWREDGKNIKGKFVEITANRRTHKFVSRGEISFAILVKGDSFVGEYKARFYDEDGKLQRSSSTSRLEGKRMVLE